MRVTCCLAVVVVLAAGPVSVRAHISPECRGQSGRGMSEYADAMIDHDRNVGTVLDKIDDLGIGDNTFVLYSTDKVHLDGFKFLPYLTGKEVKGPRESFIYCNDDQQLTGLRFDNWKLVFLEQRAPGTLAIWSEPFTSLRLPKIFNLRTDPFERADITSNTYYDWLLDHAFLLVPAQDYAGKFLMTFKEYPPRQKAASFNLDDVMKKLTESGGSK